MKVRKKRFFSLQYKILWFSFTIVLVASLSVGIVSYHKSSQTIKTKVSESNLNTVSQIGRNIEFIMNDVNNLSLNLIQHPQIREFLKMTYVLDPAEINRRKVLVEQALSSQFGSKAFIDSIYLQSFSRVVLDTSGVSNEISPSLKQEIIRRKGGKIWFSNKITDYNGSKKDVLSLIRLVNDINQPDEKLAILKINVAESDFSNLYKESAIEERSSNFVMINDDNQIVSGMNKREIGTLLNPSFIPENGFESRRGYTEIQHDGKPYLITHYRLQGIPFTLVNIVPLHALLKDNLIIRNVTVTVIVVNFLLCALLSVLFAVKVLGPLRKLRMLMADVEHGNFDVKLNIKSNDEIAKLAHSFNQMSARLKELIQKVYTTQIKQKEAEIKALQAQINPHFLYNTLDTIYWMCRMEKASESSKLVEALSKLFRSSLNSGDEITTVEDEVRHLEFYMTIQKARYEDLIEFSIHVEEQILHLQTIRLTLQPLVENAIYHGIEPTGREGKIEVNIYEENRELIFEVIDDGQGIDLEHVHRLMQSNEPQSRYGIRNVNERIQLYFGESYGLYFEHHKNGGTKVIVKQPVRR